jgi:hypothetical protein
LEQDFSAACLQRHSPIFGHAHIRQADSAGTKAQGFEVMISLESSNLTSGRDSPRHRLAYVFTGLFLLLLMAVGILGWTFFRSISTLSNSASYVSDTILHKSATTYELEINMLESGLAIVKYLQKPLPEFQEKFERNRHHFDTTEPIRRT